MSEMSGLQKFGCPHQAQTFVDERGQTVCMACGVVLQAVLTPEVLERTMRQMLEFRGRI